MRAVQLSQYEWLPYRHYCQDQRVDILRLPCRVRLGVGFAQHRALRRFLVLLRTVVLRTNDEAALGAPILGTRRPEAFRARVVSALRRAQTRANDQVPLEKNELQRTRGDSDSTAQVTLREGFYRAWH